MQQPHGHTLNAFDQDLAELRDLIIDMGSFAEAAIEEAMRCLVERDIAAAADLVEADAQLDELEAEAERRVVEVIALRAPMADDLREVMPRSRSPASSSASAIMRRISRGGCGGSPSRELEPLSLLPEMARIASEMVHDVLPPSSSAMPKRRRRCATRRCA